MQWEDEAIIISVGKYGENSLLLTVFTSQQGICAGLLKGGRSSRQKAGFLQPGSYVELSWRGRLSSHLGCFKIYSVKSRLLSQIFSSPQKLLSLQSFCHLIDFFLPQRQNHHDFYDQSQKWLSALPHDDWLYHYIKWEVSLLASTGYGLDFSCCAATGSCEDLIWVSPKTGRAVSREAGLPWQKKLLPLPSFLLNAHQKQLEKPHAVSNDDLLSGLHLTGFFIERALINLSGKKLPVCRNKLIDMQSDTPSIEVTPAR